MLKLPLRLLYLQTQLEQKQIHVVVFITMTTIMTHNNGVRVHPSIYLCCL